jgi:ubiquinone/menaquinone biosynthesis C-methylase UbiE
MSGSDAAKIGQLSEPGEYDPAMLELLQLLWGDGFLSPGGSDELDRLFEGSDIRGCEVLDIGCGLGAIDELLVTRFGAHSVIGVDIDPSLIAGMQRRVERAGLSDRIRGVKVDGGALPFDAASFDVVFSKDSMVQIPDKPKIYADVLRVLRPGGRFIASDWLRGGTGGYSPEMMEFFRLEGIAYNMVTLEESAAALAGAGFEDVEIRDRHGWYLGLAQKELAALEGRLNSVVVSRLGKERAQHFIDDWRQLVVVVSRGELRPGHLKASKSMRR